MKCNLFQSIVINHRILTVKLTVQNQLLEQELLLMLEMIISMETKKEKYNIFHNYQLISADATLYSSFQLPIHHVNVIFSQVFNQTLSDEGRKVITAILNLLLYSLSRACSRRLPGTSLLIAFIG